MKFINFWDSPWLEVLQNRRDYVQKQLEDLNSSLDQKDVSADWHGAYRLTMEEYIKLADVLLAGVDDPDAEKKLIYVLSRVEQRALIYSELPFVSSEHAQKPSDIANVIRILESAWGSNIKRADSAKTGRAEQIERTKEANKHFYKKLCDIAEDFLADGVTHSRASKKTKDYFDEIGLWVSFKSKPLSVKTVRKILREYQIIPE